MSATNDLTQLLGSLCGAVAEIASASSLRTEMSLLDDETVVALAKLASQLSRASEHIGLIATGIIGARSSREHGHSGLVQQRGHRNTTLFIQHLTGGTRAEAARQVRVADLLFESDPAGSDPNGGPGGPDDPGESGNPDGSGSPNSLTPRSWQAPLTEALAADVLSTAQADAILRGLGEPPADETAPDNGPSAAAVEAWTLAAERLVAEAEHHSVEDLTKQARAVRDLLDPEGAEARYAARYEARSFRMWTDRDGLAHGSFVFDDESAAWVNSVIDTALRPRRGGPRFVDPTEKVAADKLSKDPRSNEQLAHDLLLDVLKAGTLADASTVLGVRQAGVRLVQVVNREEYLREQAAQAEQAARAEQAALTRFEDTGALIPAAAATQQRCNTGVVPVIADEHGNPLNVGREHRLFTPKQRVALAIRDGGCRWVGCDRPPSYCEAHHIDHWVEDEGRTDIDRGVLLCSFHHMQLHHRGWRITRHGTEEFMLHPPSRNGGGGIVGPRNVQDPGRMREPEHSAAPVPLRPPLPLRYAWQKSATPPKRFRVPA